MHNNVFNLLAMGTVFCSALVSCQNNKGSHSDTVREHFIETAFIFSMTSVPTQIRLIWNNQPIIRS